MNKLKWYFCAMVLISFLAACDKECTCTDEERFNPCLTVDGQTQLPDSIGFFRELSGGRKDSLQSGSNCFADVVGKQRILIYRNDTLKTTGDWFEIEAADCCEGVPKTVDLDL